MGQQASAGGGFLSAALDDGFAQQQQQHGSAPADFGMEDLDAYSASHQLHSAPQSQHAHAQHPQQPAHLLQPLDEDEAGLGMRRIQTSPSSLYSLGDPYSHPLLPTQPRTAIAAQQQQQAAYAAQMQKKARQAAGGWPEAAAGAGYDSAASSPYYGSAASSGSGGSLSLQQLQPQPPQPLQATVLPARALPSSGASSNSLQSLSPSSSSSSLSTLNSPTRHQLAAAQSAGQSSGASGGMSAADAAAMMEQGLRRIKSSPIALSSLVVPAVNVSAAAASAGSKRQKTAASGSGDGGGGGGGGRGSQQQKAQRRLARKAEAARASRRRKKAYVVGLEEKVAKLNAKLETLRHDQLSGLKPAERLNAVDAVHREEQRGIKQRLLALLQEIRLEQSSATPAAAAAATGSSGGGGSGADSVASVTSPGSGSDSQPPSSPAAAASKRLHSASSSSSVSAVADLPSRHEELKQLVDAFVSNSHKRQSGVELHFSQLEKTLIPSVAVKFALWGLSQAEDFYVSDGLWQGVMGREVGLSSEQMRELLDCRPDVTQAVTELHEVLQRLQALRADVKRHLDERHRALEDVIAVLSPQQLAAFCLWVEQNSLCMQMLETVWQTGAV